MGLTRIGSALGLWAAVSSWPAGAAGAEALEQAAAAGPTPSADPGVQVDVAANAGMATRLDDPPTLELVDRYGLAFGFRTDVFLNRHISLGLGYEHLALGKEHGMVTRNGTIDLSRDLNRLWLRFRVYPYRSDRFGLFATVGIAAAWQSVAASGLLWPTDQPSAAQSFRCSSCAAVSFGLGANLGFEAQLAGALRLVSTVGFDSYHLSDQSLDGCAAGAGSATSLSVLAGFAYRFDVPM